MRKMTLRIKPKMYITLTLVYLVTALVSEFLARLITPNDYYGFFPSIAFFFWACGMALNGLLDRHLRVKPAEMMNTYMLFRLGKLTLTLLFLVVGVMAIGFPRLPFAISILGNYLIYSGLEIYIFYHYNKRAFPSKAKEEGEQSEAK